MTKKNKKKIPSRLKYILWFREVDKEDVGLVGGKGANLGEMASFNIPVPNGFIVTSEAYFHFLNVNRLRPRIKADLKDLDQTDPQSFQVASAKIKKTIEKAPIPEEISQEIIACYLKLGRALKHALVAVRSSATAEDLPEASFAGQQATFLNVKGEANVVEAVKDCWASTFEARAIFYRQEKGFDHFQVGMAVPVQEMVPARISGVMFTVDPVTNNKNNLVIEAIYGLGELIVQGKVIPDRYTVDKRSLKIIKREIAEQTVQLIKVRNLTRETKVPAKIKNRRKLNDSQIIELSEWGNKIHRHYYFPQDIEWAYDKGRFCILQTRPVTTIHEGEKKEKTIDAENIRRKAILTGIAASPGLAGGQVRIIRFAREIKKVENDEVLVAPMTSPDFVPAMKKASAIVTDKGGQTSHAAIVSRELGIPCVVGTQKATRFLKKGQLITVNGSRGEIYEGGLSPGFTPAVASLKKRRRSKFDARSQTKTATKIYVNLGEPELAEKMAQENIDGVGLLRAEFMMAEIGVHPKKIIKEKKEKWFVNQLAEKISLFCRPFTPRPVVYRTTDFKTNEYRHLIGGKAFEPEEENPLLGVRGAFRYLSSPNVLEMELKAIKKVRDKDNFKNLWLMIPFCRTPQEFMRVKKLVTGSGLIRSPSFKLWLMVEIPANVILLDDFIKLGIDGVSIGSNDLTMLTLGVDRDNAELAKDFDEQNPAVLWLIEKTVKDCLKAKITVSICGQAPSVYPDLVEKLISWGITSLSVNPDAISKAREIVSEAEKGQVKKNG